MAAAVAFPGDKDERDDLYARTSRGVLLRSNVYREKMHYRAEWDRWKASTGELVSTQPFGLRPGRVHVRSDRPLHPGSPPPLTAKEARGHGCTWGLGCLAVAVRTPPAF